MLLFIDSFDHYANTNIPEKWTQNVGGTIAPGQGRNGSSALRVNSFNNYVLKGLPTTSNVMIIGVAIKTTTIDYASLNLGEAATNHVALMAEVNGALRVDKASGTGFDYGPNNLLASTLPGIIQPNIWYHVQLKIVCADAPTGTVDLRVNGVLLASNNACDTRSGGLGRLDTIRLGGQNYFDDLWVCDGTGGPPWNSFLGDCRVDARYPQANGTSVGWTPSIGAPPEVPPLQNFQCVDEPLPNSDADFTWTGVAGVTDTFVVQDAPVAGSFIYGVQQCLSVRKTDAGPASIAPVIRAGPIGGELDYPGENQQPSTLYTTMVQVAAANPATGVQWTEAEFNRAEFGYRRTV